MGMLLCVAADVECWRVDAGCAIVRPPDTSWHNLPPVTSYLLYNDGQISPFTINSLHVQSAKYREIRPVPGCQQCACPPSADGICLVGGGRARVQHSSSLCHSTHFLITRSQQPEHLANWGPDTAPHLATRLHITVSDWFSIHNPFIGLCWQHFWWIFSSVCGSIQPAAQDGAGVRLKTSTLLQVRTNIYSEQLNGWFSDNDFDKMY